ncbi:DUF305 domain-containing protein [Acuticoccus sp.]|uniref:CopM family metallochaperone n=1 Tax=Acuticoccus sp. TaxID=1904378 RepID=UPI003B5295F7
MRSLTILVVAAMASLGVPEALAQHTPQAHGAPAASLVPDSPATAAFRDTMARMHRDMDIRYANDVDVDFVRAMIPHHQAAVEMAEVLLSHSQDAELRALAEAIVATQQAEIEAMRAMLERLGRR